MKFFLLVCIFALFGCSSNKADRNVINLIPNKDVSIFDIVESIDIVPLETNPQSLIHTIEQVFSYNNRYYICDIMSQAVFCFDAQGKFLFKIAQAGKGPEEYTYLESISIDPYNQQLLLIVPFGDILYFDLDGHFISRDNIPDAGAINEVHVLDTNHLLFISLNTYQALYYDKNEKRITKRLYPDEDLALLIPLHRTYCYNDSVYFTPVLGREVLNMSSHEPSVSFVWDFGKDNNTSQQIERTKTYLAEYRTQQRNRKYLTRGDIVGEYLNHCMITDYETNRFRMAIVEKDGLLYVYHDKKQDKDFVFRQTKEGITPFTFNFYDNTLVMQSKPFYVKNIQAYDKSTLSPEQLEIVESHDPENDNPFLIVYKLKQ